MYPLDMTLSMSTHKTQSKKTHIHRMGKKLVIVESPAKAKTINKYLGSDFKVLASYGHIMDLVPKEGAVNTDTFEMKYQVVDKNKKHVDAIVKAAKTADAIYLATDPDREGEAISWNVYEYLKEKKVIEETPVHRVVFHEITKKAVTEAINNPRELAQPLINAQQARRALDYLVGFNLSPLLWRKVQRGLSAGRVQSPALRLIVEREAEIDAFDPKEYWSIAAEGTKDGAAVQSRLHTYNGEKVEQFSFTNETDAEAARSALELAADGKLQVDKVESKKRRRFPAAPFITSTLQQEASKRLGFGASRTMRLAQQLYEGVAIDEGTVGLITYMRTDSVSLAGEAVSEIRSEITNLYGNNMLPNTPPEYKTKSKNAQEAHEAIRPTSAARTPRAMAQYLNDDQRKLYELIWSRAVASQMVPAILNTTSVDLAAGQVGTFRASGTVIVEEGFLKVYKDIQEGKEKDTKILPPLVEGEVISIDGVQSSQHFTAPPPRFTEASLIKSLEEFGIGRPSTYASIISTLVARNYVELESRRFFPTDVGKVVNRFLTEHFTQYVDYDFTAKLEDELDSVSRGEVEWKPLMKEFWEPFHATCEEKAELSRADVLQSRELGIDPKSGKPVTVRLGRFGPMAQIGTAEDEEKPKFAGLLAGQKMDTITLEEALELFKMPRQMGEFEGEKVSIGIGRFGPYVRFGKKFVSIKEPDDPYTIEYDRAVELIKAKLEEEANRIIKVFEGSDIQILKGRWGPYITDGKKNAKIPKDTDPESLTLEVCADLIAKAPEKKKRATRRKK